MNAEATKDKAKSDAKAVNKDGKKLNLFEHPGENAPVLPSINDSMKFDLIINDKKKSMLIVDTPFPEILYWAEYDLDMDELYFVTVRGKILPLGKKVATMFRPFMSQATYITAVRMQGEKLADLLQKNFKTMRAYLLKEEFQLRWEYISPTWAGKPSTEPSM